MTKTLIDVIVEAMPARPNYRLEGVMLEGVKLVEEIPPMAELRAQAEVIAAALLAAPEHVRLKLSVRLFESTNKGQPPASGRPKVLLTDDLDKLTEEVNKVLANSPAASPMFEPGTVISDADLFTLKLVAGMWLDDHQSCGEPDRCECELCKPENKIWDALCAIGVR